MNKKLIQQLLDDDETRARIAVMFIQMANDAAYDEMNYDDIMVETLNKLNNTLVKGDMITIQVCSYMWVRGEYVRPTPSGELLVEVPANRSEIIGASAKYYQGKRVDLVIKGEEGDADV